MNQTSQQDGTQSSNSVMNFSQDQRELTHDASRKCSADTEDACYFQDDQPSLKNQQENPIQNLSSSQEKQEQPFKSVDDSSDRFNQYKALSTTKSGNSAGSSGDFKQRPQGGQYQQQTMQTYGSHKGGSRGSHQRGGHSNTKTGGGGSCYSSGGSSSSSYHTNTKEGGGYRNNSSSHQQPQPSQYYYQQQQQQQQQTEHYSSSQQYQYPSSGQGGRQSHHKQMRKQGSGTHHQHHGGSSNNSGHGSRSDNQQQPSQFAHHGGQGNYSGQQGANTATQSMGESIPQQYYDGDQIVIPVWQPMIRCKESMLEMNILQRELFDLATKGDLLIELEIFVGILADRLGVTEDEVYFLIEQAEKQGIVHQTRRNFAKMKNLCFISLQLDIISHECIQWVLTSLKKDEMTPTERAIQSRIKEAFAFKISGPLWEYIIESLSSPSSTSKSNKHRQVIVNPNKNKQYGTYNNSYNEYYNIQKYSSPKSNQITHMSSPKQNYIYQDRKNKLIPEFIIKEIEEDPSIGQMTKAIYVKNSDEWLGVDQQIEEIDFNLYDELKSFLQDYFCQSSEQPIEEHQSDTTSKNEDENLTANNKWCSSIENALTRTTGGTTVYQTGKINATSYMPSNEIDLDEIRAIPGGRYGCAQFVKICGPSNLTSQSLGRLAQLVQYAVKEDVLRYHKTLLVWTTTVDKHKRQAEELQKESHQKAAIGAKLTIVKNALIEILAESKTGMSLAQLPLYLRRKLPFILDLNELGFPKLKDLILSMSDKIKLELRGHNHPFAYLMKSGRYVHSSSNSDDFQAIPKSKGLLNMKDQRLSEDVNLNRHLKNTIFLNDESSIRNVLTAFLNALREVPFGIRSDELSKVLSSKIGYEFDFKNYNCHSLIEFIKKFVIPTMDIEIIVTGPSETDSFIIRSRQFYMNCNYDLAKQQHIEQMTRMPEELKVQQQYSQPIQQAKVMNRQDSGSSSLNISSQIYVPNHTSLYGGSNSVNTSTNINISHIRFNTADTAEIQHNIMPKQEIHQSLVTNTNPFTKPPLPPGNHLANQHNQILNSLQVHQHNLSIQNANIKSGNAYKTYPPKNQIQQQQPIVAQQQQIIKHQQTQSNSTNGSGNSQSTQQMIPLMQGQFQNLNTNSQFRPNFFLSPGQLQLNKLGDQFNQLNQSQSPLLHSRATSFNNSQMFGTAGGSGGVITMGGNQSQNTPKSASQDFSIQSSIMPMMMGAALQSKAHYQASSSSSANASGFITPQIGNYHHNHPFNMYGSSSNFNNPSRSYFPHNPDSLFGSPIPRSYYNNANQAHSHYENSSSPAPYDQEDDDEHKHQSEFNIKFIERLICDDDAGSDFKSAGCGPNSIQGDDPFSGNVSAMQSPKLSSVNSGSVYGSGALRVPHSSLFSGAGPGSNLNVKQQKKNLYSNEFILKLGGGSVSSQHSSSSKSGSSKLQQSNSCKSIKGAIIEGGSSSSDENKRPSTVLEQRTEEDAEDMSASVLNQKWNNLMNQQQPSSQNNLLYQQQQQLNTPTSIFENANMTSNSMSHNNEWLNDTTSNANSNNYY